jgi:hypothetical protein
MAGRKAQKSGTTAVARGVRRGEKKVPGVGATNTKGSERKTTKAPQPQAMLSHEQIAQRAEVIWQQKGCPPDQDEQNWKEAEDQLKSELGIA